MISILFFHLSITLVLCLITYLLFLKFRINDKLAKLLKFRLKFHWIFIISIILIFNLILKPNLFERVQGYHKLIELKESEIKYFELTRLNPDLNDKDNKYDTLNIKLKDRERINYLITEIQQGKFMISERRKPEGYRWKGKAYLTDSSIIHFQFIQNPDNLIIIPYYKNAQLAYYKNKRLLKFFENFEK